MVTCYMLSCSVVSDSLWPLGLLPTRLLWPWGFSRQELLEWVAMPSSRGSSWPRHQTGVSYIAGGFFTDWAMRETHILIYTQVFLAFQKITLQQFCFYERTTSVPIFTDINFFFIKGKTKVMFSIFAVSSYRAGHTSGCQSGTSSSFPRNYTQHQVVIALNCV